MNHLLRRQFTLQLAAVGAALISAKVDGAEDRVTESDPYAKSMGFRLDTTKVDKVRYPRHTDEQTCAKCQLFEGKASDAVGPCSFYGGRLVSPNGWCKNFKIKKA